MAPRRRHATPNTQAAAPSFASLPDGVLVQIAGLLGIKDRCGTVCGSCRRCRAAPRHRSHPPANLLCRHTAALVSRRWHAAVHSPQVLATVVCQDASVSRLESLTAWLQRHRQHVHTLALECTPSADNVAPCMWQLAECMAALAAAGQLQTLGVSVSGGTDLCVTSWGTALRQLHSLDLECSGATLRICSSLSGLTALSSISLWGQKVAVDAAAQLPPNVERMCFEDRQSDTLPHQVCQCSSIHARPCMSTAVQGVSLQYVACKQSTAPRCPTRAATKASHRLSHSPAQLSGLTRLSLLVRACVRIRPCTDPLQR